MMTNEENILNTLSLGRFIEVVAERADGSMTVRNSRGEHTVSRRQVMVAYAKSLECVDRRGGEMVTDAHDCNCYSCTITVGTVARAA